LAGVVLLFAAQAHSMNTTFRKAEKVTARNAAIKTYGGAKGIQVAAIYTQAIKILRPTGMPLLTAASRYAQAVKILGADRVLEAARHFARQNSSRRRPGTRKSEPISICSPTELRALLAVAPGWFRPVLAIQAFAGLRPDEVLRLDWKDVKRDCGHIEIGRDRTKAAARRLAPIPPNLVRWLADAAKRSGKVFPYSPANFTEIQVSTATEAEVSWKLNALRHSFISYRMAQTSDAARVSLESGTSPGTIFKRYRALGGEMDARQWFTIVP
jgi:integrase